MLQELLQLNVFASLLIFARIGMMMMLMPGIGAVYVSPRIRLLFAVALCFLLTPILAGDLPGPPQSAIILVLLIISEMLIGAFLGLLAQIFMSALQTAGSLISLFASLANALIQDPIANQQSSIMSNFLSVTGTVLIFVTDLHHLMLYVLVESYMSFPAGNPLPAGDVADVIARAVGDSFVIAFKLSIPFLVIAMIYFIGLGILGRLMPQLPVFFFGLPVQVGAQLGALMVTLSAIMMAFLSYFRDGFEALLGL